MRSPKIIFIGTGQFAVPVLEKLVESKYQIIKVITAMDKPAGRKQILTPSPVKQVALKHNLPLGQLEKIAELKPDLIIVASYGQIIPKNILKIPRLGCLNLHPSLLPKYRGASPIQFAILNNEKITGITFMLMDEKIDHGPIIAQKEAEIGQDDTYQSLEKKLSSESARFLLKILPQYLNNKIKPQAQKHDKATYTKILTRQDGRINWSKSAQEISRMVRAFYPWPGAWTEFNNKRLKILKVKITKGSCLSLELVQPEGKKSMTGKEFFRGIKK